MGPGRELALRRPAAISAGDQERSVEARDQVEHWLRHGRRPVAPRPPRRDARRAGAHPAPVRRRRRPHRSRRGDLAPSRLPPDRGVPGLEPRTGAVPGRRLRRPARPPWSSRSRRPKRPATCAWPRSPGCISGASSVRSGRTRRARAALEAATAWHRAAGGGEQAALGECLLAAIDAADGVAGAERTARRDPRRRRGATTTPTSRSSPSTPSPASPPRRATSPPRRTSARRPIGAWKPPRTSSPSATGPTPLGAAGSDGVARRWPQLTQSSTPGASSSAPGPSVASVISAASSLGERGRHARSARRTRATR